MKNEGSNYEANLESTYINEGGLESEGIDTRIGQMHYLKKKYKYRVDAPKYSRGKKIGKEHYHIYHNNNEIYVGNVDGTTSHNYKNSKKVPKWVMNEVKNSQRYKEGSKGLRGSEKG